MSCGHETCKGTHCYYCGVEFKPADDVWEEWNMRWEYSHRPCWEAHEKQLEAYFDLEDAGWDTEGYYGRTERPDDQLVVSKCSESYQVRRRDLPDLAKKLIESPDNEKETLYG